MVTFFVTSSKTTGYTKFCVFWIRLHNQMHSSVFSFTVSSWLTAAYKNSVVNTYNVSLEFLIKIHLREGPVLHFVFYWESWNSDKFSKFSPNPNFPIKSTLCWSLKPPSECRKKWCFKQKSLPVTTTTLDNNLSLLVLFVIKLTFSDNTGNNVQFVC